jgi:acetyltransferase-like isoleucine patch superfamily enzyme
MKTERPIEDQEYVRIIHTQFNQSNTLSLFRKLLYYLVLPFIFPLILMAKTSEHLFHGLSELLSLIPFPFGVIIRNAFYRQTLTSCGDNVFIAFGSVFLYKNISIGNNVLVGFYCTINHCDIGNNVLISDGCRFLSGSRQHGFERTDIPMTMQDGWMKKITIGNDVWIGANSVIMDDIEEGSIIGAGSVVNKKVEKYSICAGNPVKLLRKRT